MNNCNLTEERLKMITFWSLKEHLQPVNSLRRGLLSQTFLISIWTDCQSDGLVGSLSCKVEFCAISR